MGTRIHKVLGYGIKEGVDHARLRDLVYENTEKGEVAKLMNAAYQNKEVADDLFLYLEGTLLKEAHSQGYPDWFHDVIHYAEYPDADDGWWVIVPPAHYHDWYRWDNSVDYYECYPHGDLETVVKELDIPLYPYSYWMDKNTGERLKDYAPLSDGYYEHIVPWVPEAVQVLAKHFEMPDWRLFRPVLIRWWC